MPVHHRLVESPGLDQNEPITVMTGTTLCISQKPFSALISNAMAHCALEACRAVQVPITNLAEIPQCMSSD